MRLRLLIGLPLVACCVAIAAWSHARTGRSRAAFRAEATTPHAAAALTVAGTIGSAITTPIVGRIEELSIAPGTPVRRGQVIGVGAVQPDPLEMGRAERESEAAASAVAAAQREAGTADRELLVLRTSHLDAESGAASPRHAALDLDAAEARSRAARATLRHTAMRRERAEFTLGALRERSRGGPIVAPVDGMLVAEELPDGVAIGVASNPAKLSAYAIVQDSDLHHIRVGQEVEIIVDEVPSLRFRGRVSSIADVSGDDEEWSLHLVTFEVEGHGGTWFSSAAMHARLKPF